MRFNSIRKDREPAAHKAKRLEQYYQNELRWFRAQPDQDLRGIWHKYIAYSESERPYHRALKVAYFERFPQMRR